MDMYIEIYNVINIYIHIIHLYIHIHLPGDSVQLENISTISLGFMVVTTIATWGY